MDKLAESILEALKPYGLSGMTLRREEFSNEDWAAHIQAIRYLSKKGLVQMSPAMGYIHVKPTANGFDYLSGETAFSQPSAAPIFNISNPTNAIIGTQHDFTVHIGSSLDDVQKLISCASSKERLVLEEMLQLLKEIEASREPVPRGFLAKYAEPISKVAQLAGTIGDVFLRWFTQG